MLRLPESVQEVLIVVRSEDIIYTHPTTLQHLWIVNNWNMESEELDLAHIKIHKLTIETSYFRLKQWPRELKELEFVGRDEFTNTYRVPRGCRIVGERRPINIIME